MVNRPCPPLISDIKSKLNNISQKKCGGENNAHVSQFIHHLNKSNFVFETFVEPQPDDLSFVAIKIQFDFRINCKLKLLKLSTQTFEKMKFVFPNLSRNIQSFMIWFSVLQLCLIILMRLIHWSIVDRFIYSMTAYFLHVYPVSRADPLILFPFH